MHQGDPATGKPFLIEAFAIIPADKDNIRHDDEMLGEQQVLGARRGFGHRIDDMHLPCPRPLQDILQGGKTFLAKTNTELFLDKAQVVMRQALRLPILS